MGYDDSKPINIPLMLISWVAQVMESILSVLKNNLKTATPSMVANLCLREALI